MRMATCHPDRKHEARDLCYQCYQSIYRQGVRPRIRQNNRMPEFEPDWLRAIPNRAAGVRQNATTSFPLERCPHCLRDNSIVYHGREARCAGVLGGCGHTVYLVREDPVLA